MTRHEPNSVRQLLLVVATAALSVALALAVNWQHFTGSAGDECIIRVAAADAP